MGKKILVADDEEGNRRILQIRLKAKGYEVIAVEDGESALQRFLTERPDLVILDVSMPPPNGFQLCQKLKSHPDHHKTPVILLTGKGTDKDRFWGMEAGADEYMTKPFDAEELYKKVKALLAT